MTRDSMTDTDLKTFHIGAILSVTTGRLVSPGGIGDVYDILNWMTGESLYTHQLPRVSREAAPVLLKAHPQLCAAIEEAGQVNTENWQDWLTTWVDRYGETLPVPKMSADDHERIDPLSELAEKIPPEKIVVVRP